MNILTRYILGIFFRLLALCTGAFTALYLIIDFIEKIRRFTRAKADISSIGTFFLCKTPTIISELMPLSILLATLLTMGTLSRSQELTAMRSCGMSLKKIAGPLLLSAFAASLLLLGARETVIPRLYQQVRYIEDVQLKKIDSATFFRQNNIWYREGNFVVQAKVFDPATRLLKGITLWEIGGEGTSRRIDALDGGRTPGGWALKNVTVREFSGASLERTSRLESLTVPLKLGIDDLKKVAKDAEDMGFIELRRYCAKLSRGGFDATRYRADMHAKLAGPFGCLVMACLGVPFSLRGTRSGGTAFGIAQSLGIGFAYLVVSAVFLSFGHNGILPPAISAWAANILFTLAGAWLALTMEVR